MKNKIKNMNKRQLIGTVLIVLTTLVMIVTGVTSKGRKSDELEKYKPVNVYEVPFRDKVFINGKIAPRNTETFVVSPEKASSAKIKVEDGQSVGRGNTIITYENEEIKKQVTDMNADLADLREQKSKMQSAGGGVADGVTPVGASTVEIDSQIKKMERSLASLKSSQTTEEKATIEGTVYRSKQALEGGTEVETITIQSNDYVMNGSVNEKDLLKIEEGLEAEVTIVTSDTIIKGTIENISKKPNAAGDPNSSGQGTPGGGGTALSSYEVRIAIDSQEDLIEGFHVQAKIEIGEDSIEIPRAALTGDETDPKVFLVKDDRVRLKRVEIEEITDVPSDEIEIENLLEKDLLEEDTSDDEILDESQEDEETTDETASKNDLVRVISGLEEGDKIVLSPDKDLLDGDYVKASEATEETEEKDETGEIPIGGGGSIKRAPSGSTSVGGVEEANSVRLEKKIAMSLLFRISSVEGWRNW